MLSAPQRRNNLAALALLGIAVLLLSQLGMGKINVEAGLPLLIIGSCFLFFACWRRIYGLSIPGFILSGLSIGVTFAGLADGVSILWGLSLGFLMTYIVGSALFRVRSAWPVIPSVILLGIGSIMAASMMPAIFVGSLIWLPLLLVGAGLYLGRGRRTA